MAELKPSMIALADHPRAADSIRQIKGWGGLAGFVAVTGYAYLSGMGLPDALLRGVIAGVLAQMLAWIAGIVLWQHLLDGEARMLVKRMHEIGRAAQHPRGAAGGYDA
jgi:hypothetical protein